MKASAASGHVTCYLGCMRLLLLVAMRHMVLDYHVLRRAMYIIVPHDTEMVAAVPASVGQCQQREIPRLVLLQHTLDLAGAKTHYMTSNATNTEGMLASTCSSTTCTLVEESLTHSWQWTCLHSNYCGKDANMKTNLKTSTAKKDRVGNRCCVVGVEDLSAVIA